jgi:hypothetical protein
MCGHVRTRGKEESAACEEEEARHTDGQATMARGEGTSQGRGQDLGERVKGKGKADEEGRGVKGGGGRCVGRVEGPKNGDEGKD